ncbi:hypothetical protein [Cupriavidus sp. amp6]|uniref:hypothetical protein n=1 Tax=Cupriavidus sp. amp6 TaxID=388051 RepID=UPI00048BBDC7|nr:hypothetical protein [Cupriavidus sp. amp6]
MNEGLRRTAAVLRWTGYTFLILATVVFVINVFSDAVDALIKAVMIGIFSIPLLAAAWIINGFAQRR